MRGRRHDGCTGKCSSQQNERNKCTGGRACWLNQIEMYFSVVKRKVLTPNKCVSLAKLRDRLCVSRIMTSPPLALFSGSSASEDLRTLLTNIDVHEKTFRKAA